MFSTLKRHLLALIKFLKIQDPNRLYGPNLLRTSEHTPSVYPKVVRIGPSRKQPPAPREPGKLTEPTSPPTPEGLSQPRRP